MDPASAIGVAAATVQFFAIGVKAIRLGRQISVSKTGTIDAYEALEVSLKAIREIRKDLRGDVISNVDSNIAKAQKQCLDIAEKLLKVLESIKVTSQTAKSKLLKDVTATLRVMRARSKIDKMEAELNVAKNYFAESLTVETRNAIAQVLEDQGKDTTLLQLMWDDIQHLRPELQEARKENNAAHQATLSGIARIDQTSVAHHTSAQSSHQAMRNAVEKVDISIHSQFSSMRMTDVHRDILASLHYPDMLTRQQDISPPATGTYEWVFTGESPYQNDPEKYKDILSTDIGRRKKLLQWFSNDEPLFWINGKPGSGKSSLMSYIANDERTMQALITWAGLKPVHVITFFFWRPGPPLQRSVPGMLRSLLYQLLMMETSAIDTLLANNSLRRHATWEQIELLRTLENVLKIRSKEHMCFFIDGLDEHDGDYMSLLDLIMQTQVNSNIKICLSSRPEPAFRHRLKICPTISMQDLNTTDIETLVRQKLGTSGTMASSLIKEVTERAEGVVLWAALVCNSLLRGLTMHDDEAMLRKRLEETPSGLKDLFSHMFSKIDNVHREYLTIYCHLLKWASETKHKTHYTSLSLISAVSQSADCTSLDQLVSNCASREQQIIGQSQGLIEISGREDRPARAMWSLRRTADQGIARARSHSPTNELFKYSRHHIHWIHRSAHDCIFGEHNETIAPWILMADDLEFRRKTIHSLLWFTEHLPMVIMWELEEGGIVMEAALDDLVQDIIPLTSHDEGCRIVQEFHDLTLLAFPGPDRQRCHKELQDIAAHENAQTDELLPLFSLWVGVLEGGRYSYVDQLANEPFATELCSQIITSSFTGGDEAIICRLLDHISRDLQSRTDKNFVSSDFLQDRQFGFRQYSRRHTPRPVSPIVLSWQGSHDRDEVDIMHDLALLRGRATESSLPHQAWPRVLAMLETRRAWRGPQAVDENDNILPLQLLLPNDAFARMWERSQSSAAPSLTNPISPFRLVCLHRSKRRSNVQRLPLQLTYEHRVVATFDLSLKATASLLLQSQWWTPDIIEDGCFTKMRSLEMTWVGTAAAYSSCLHAILDDIRDDRNQQLDAWQ